MKIPKIESIHTDIIGIIVGAIIALISIVISYIFYRKCIRIKDPRWAIQSNNLIRGRKSRLSELKITYKDRIIGNLTISKLIFWNEGLETIDHQDTQTVNPIRIVGKGNIALLDVKVLCSNNSSSKFLVRLINSKNYAYLNFDYLDNKHGAVIQVIHTGISSDELTVVGDIKEVKPIRRELLLAPK